MGVFAVGASRWVATRCTEWQSVFSMLTVVHCQHVRCFSETFQRDSNKGCSMPWFEGSPFDTVLRKAVLLSRLELMLTVAVM